MTSPVGVSCDWADDTAPFGVDKAPDIDPDLLHSMIANELAQLSMSGCARYMAYHQRYEKHHK